jgi:hypothetical protein
MKSKPFPRRNKTTARTQELKEAILASFANPVDAVDRLHGFSDADWKSVLWWLDISGLAIYFFVQSQEVGAGSLLPEWVHEDLAQRLGNNRIRIAALRREACGLAHWLEGGGVRYALLKGITLAPDAVPDSTFRSQADLDILVAQQNMKQAIHYIQRLGYRLHAMSGNTLEFRAGEASVPDMANMYSVRTQRALELHLLAETEGQPSLLTRREWRVFNDTEIAVLSPPDILLQQAKHLVKHLCGEYTRLSWVLEFRRHVQNRLGDDVYWRSVERIASGEKNGDLAIGMALWVAEEFFGKIPMEMPRQWSAEALPARVLLWLKRYARSLLMGDAIGSKLYALLHREMPGAVEQQRSTCKILFPHYLPAPIMQRRSRERLVERMERYAVEMDFFFRRLQFHVVEGVRFGIEASRWRRNAERCER